MYRPCSYRVIVKIQSLAETDPVYKKAKNAGIELPVDHEDFRRQENAIDKGVVVEIGPAAFKEWGGAEANGIKVGKTVVFAKYAGKVLTDKDTKYQVLNDEDIVAVEE